MRNRSSKRAATIGALQATAPICLADVLVASHPLLLLSMFTCRDAEDKQLVHFYVGCSKGTYIRTLGHDLATSLGTTGQLGPVAFPWGGEYAHICSNSYVICAPACIPGSK